MSNSAINRMEVTGEGLPHLAVAMDMAMDPWGHRRKGQEPRPITGWTVRSDAHVSIVLVSVGDAQHPFPAPLGDSTLLATMVMGWLDGLDVDRFGPYPDRDGSIERGWLLSLDSPSADIVVAPCWVVYGK